MITKQTKPGTVYLVGAGPGDPELITVRGLTLLRQADVVVYDRLVHPALLSEPRLGAERIYVGKAPGRHTCPQGEINALLVHLARRHRIVVRLKGGDPFVFGRGGEECEVLAEAGIPFEVVPGVTSAISAPAFAGIPVTHRGVATAFTVVTGHTCDPASADLDWAALAGASTLVILMGLGRIGAIAQRLIDNGRSPDTPVAIICNGTLSHQEVVAGTLATIGEAAARLRPPATVVVGDVVSLRSQLAWFSPGPASRAVDVPSPGISIAPPARLFASAVPA